MERIVILGAGFAGLYTALNLGKKFQNKKIVVINKNNYFLFTPLLHEVATGAQNRHNITFEIRKILKDRLFEFYKAEIKRIDFSQKKVFFDNSSIDYDKLIIAIGSRASYNIKGAREYSFPLKDIQDSIKIKNKIIDSMEKASVSSSQEEIEKLTTFIVMGGGPTGVELSAEISQLLKEILPYYPKLNKVKIHLIQRNQKVMPELLHDRCIQLTLKELKKKNVNVLVNSEVREILEDRVILNNQITIKTFNKFLTAGVIPNTIPAIPKLTDDHGFYKVNEFFEVENIKNVYAIGDCALNYNPGNDKPNPKLAQLAVKQAKHLAKNLYLEGKNKKKIPFIFKPDGFLVSVGSWWAIAEVKNKLIKGKFAWWLWRTIYLSKIIGVKNKIRIGIEWFILLFSKRDASAV